MARLNALKDKAVDLVALQTLLKEKDFRLNLGCGEVTQETHLNIDIRDLDGVDLVFDLRDIVTFNRLFPRGSIKELLAYDVLEHFPRMESAKLLKAWCDCLAQGGKIVLRVPDLEYIMKRTLDRAIPFQVGVNLIYGEQDYEYNFHLCGYNGDILEGILSTHGCRVVQRIGPEEQDSHNLTLVAIKEN